MSSPGPDEKICPFCAETIKAAAIKCRYCQSDLSEAAPVTTREDQVVSTGSVSTGSTTGAETTGSSVVEPVETTDGRELPLLASFRLLRVLVVLCLVLALLTAAAWLFSRSAADAETQGPITSVEARDAGLQAATRLTEKVLSYDWKNLSQDTREAEAVMAPSFRAEYAKAMAGVKDQTLKNKVALEAKAVATSIVSAGEHKVVALVFVNQVTTAAGTRNQRLDQNRVLVTLTRGEGEWRVSKLDAF